MPSDRPSEEDDAVPLTDLLRTGEASRLRRRGAMRGGHRRATSDESTIPSNRRVRIDAHDGDRPEDATFSLELSCGVRTPFFASDPSSSSRPSPLPQLRRSNTTSDLGFVYKSTGCGTVVSSAARPNLRACSSAHQVYVSTDTSNPEVARLPSSYMDGEHCAIAEAFSRGDASCKCAWEGIGCRVCGNSLGFVHIPCHPGHSLEVNRTVASTIYIFFSSSVTPSPSYSFPSIEHAHDGNPHTDPPSESDMSSESPIFSPRAHLVREDENFMRSYSQDIELFDFSAPAMWPPPPRRRPASQTISDDEWNAFFEGDQAPSSSRHPPPLHYPLDSYHSQHSSWAPRHIRDRTPVGGARTVADRFASSDGNAPRFVHSTASARRSDPTALHRVPRRPLSTIPPQNRRTSSLDSSSPWRPRTAVQSQPQQHLVAPLSSSLSAHAPSEWQGQPIIRDGEGGGGLRVSRWGSGTIRRRQPTPGNPNVSTATAAAAPPAFTLFDSMGERNYPPSAQSSIDGRDTLSVVDESDNTTDVSSQVPSIHFYNYTFSQPRISRGDGGGGGGGLWDRLALTEGPEADDEDKADEEQQQGNNERPELGRGRSPYVFHAHHRQILDEQSLNSVSQLPLG